MENSIESQTFQNKIFAEERVSKKEMSVPRNEVLWDGGSTLKLIDHVFEISVAKRNKYKEIFESLITTFQNDIDKVTIMQDCAAKADEIKEAFTERRSQAKRQTASTASLLEVVKSCRKQKLEIMEKSQGDLEAEFVLLETDAPNRPTGPMVLKTPAKYSMSEAYETRKRIMTRQEKESTMNEFRRVLFRSPPPPAPLFCTAGTIFEAPFVERERGREGEEGEEGRGEERAQRERERESEGVREGSFFTNCLSLARAHARSQALSLSLSL